MFRNMYSLSMDFLKVRNLTFMLSSKIFTSMAPSAALLKCNVTSATYGKNSRSLSMGISNYSALAVPLSYDVFLPETQPTSKLPIIVLLALLDSKEQWKDLGKAISIESKRIVYTLDTRNHGDSPHTAGHNYPLMSEDVKRFMVSQSIPEAVFVGHSMGGRTAMLLALTKESFVKKLMVVDIAPEKLPPQADFVHGYLKAMKEALTSIPSMGLAQGRAAVDAYLSKTIPRASIRAFLLESLTERDGILAWKPNIDSLLEKFDTKATLFPSVTGCCYTGETLFICGGNSKFVKPEDYPVITTLFPKAKFVSIPNAEHWVHRQKPAEFVQTVCNFL